LKKPDGVLPGHLDERGGEGLSFFENGPGFGIEANNRMFPDLADSGADLLRVADEVNGSFIASERKLINLLLGNLVGKGS
jgi:hypothetical protein